VTNPRRGQLVILWIPLPGGSHAATEGSHGDVADVAIDDMAPCRLRVSLTSGPAAGLASEVQFAGFRHNGASTARRHSDRSGRRQRRDT
jgi:hypothetical protein